MWLKIPVDLETEAAKVHLLGELERWNDLGLLSPGQIINIARKLTSPLPIPYNVHATEPQSTDAEQATEQPPTTLHKPIFAGLKTQLVQSFVDELSVLWLLFLGVFLVLVSSGVLAASRWQSFSAVGQYSILLLYTLAFGGASYWATRRNQLKTTAQMLKAATLLLIPINMWMMDALGVFNASIGWLPFGLVAVGLSGLTLVLTSRRRVGWNLVGLSWLHWGWSIAVWPLATTYIATVGSAANLFLPDTADSEATGEGKGQSGGILVAIALLILLIRSLWIAQVPIYQLGLASSICGWMLCRLKYPLWPRLGAGLMLLGWLVSVEQQPLQALGVSGLAIWLLVERLQQQTEKRQQLRTLATLWLIAFQACGLMWLVLPMALRNGLLMWVSRLIGQPVYALDLAGIWLNGYVALMLWTARKFRRKGKVTWSELTERLTVGISGLLVLFAIPQAQSWIFTASLFGLTTTLGVLSCLRQPATRLVYATYGAGLATVISSLNVISRGNWTQPQWSMALITLVLVEWAFSVADDRYLLWRRSAWYFGLFLSAIAYLLLLSNGGSWLNLTWLVVPTALTTMVYRQAFPTNQPKQATFLAILALLGQGLLINSWSIGTVVLGSSALLIGLHSLRWPTQQALTTLAVGAMAGTIYAGALWLWLPKLSWAEGVGHLYLLTAIVAAALTVVAQALTRRSRLLLESYGRASQGWSHLLALVLTVVLTVMMAFFFYLRFDLQPLSLGERLQMRYGLAALAIILARFAANRRQINWWTLAYGLGLLVTMGLSLWHRDVVNGAFITLIARAMLVLALGSQLMGTVYAKGRSYKTSWHYIPLAYGLFGVVLGHFEFTSTTGFYSGLVGIVALAIGRRQPNLRPLSYAGLGLFSLGLYELVIYRLLQASGGAVGDGFTLLALVGSAIALLYLLCQRWLQRWSQLALADLEIAGTLHWLLGIILATLAMVGGQSRTGVWLWLGVASLLGLHAFLKGNNRWVPTYGRPLSNSDSSAAETASSRMLVSDHPRYSQWTWSGLIIATVALPYGLGQLVTTLDWLQAWGALGLCGIGLAIYQLPWQRWGWPASPWRRMALSWPILGILFGLPVVKTQSLLLVGAFYGVMAKRLNAVRLSYLSIVLFNWSLGRYLFEQGWFNPLWLGTMLGMSTLYILEVDPRWQLLSLRQERHYLRSLATLLIGLTTLYQVETTTSPGTTLGLITVGLLLSLGFMLAGLKSRVRAYLYVGTLTFTLQILRTIMMFIDTDGSLLWAIGIVLGIALIWVAATFEVRQAQVRELLTHWSTQLQSWD
ncbi:MAG: hypothetical protein AAF821_10745 [Cyanobacteria bacterium P01_D01_bin.156]